MSLSIASSATLAPPPFITLAPVSPLLARAPQVNSNVGNEDSGAANSAADNYTPTEDSDDGGITGAPISGNGMTGMDLTLDGLTGNGIQTQNSLGPSGIAIPGGSFGSTVNGPGNVPASSGTLNPSETGDVNLSNDVTVNDATTNMSTFATTIVGSATISSASASAAQTQSTSISGSAAPKSAAGKSVQLGFTVKQILGASVAVAACALWL